ncbi:MAG: hypothetical protein ACLRFQ_01715 [Alphaproteobacteria bacterium]
MKLSSGALMFYSQELNTLFLLNVKTNEMIQIKDKSAKKIYKMLKKSKNYNVDLSELVKMGFVDDK